jgi:hypothetical protein
MNRTVQFFGQGYGSSPATIVVKLEGLTIFSGEIPTIDQTGFNTAPDDQVVLFTCELPVTFEGLKPMLVEVLTGTVALAHIRANYCFYNSDDLYFDICPGADARKNVKINGELQTPDQDLSGTWSWTVSAGSTLSYDLNVTGGTES